MLITNAWESTIDLWLLLARRLITSALSLLYFLFPLRRQFAGRRMRVVIVACHWICYVSSTYHSLVV